MIKIWAKIVHHDKILKSIIYQNDVNFNASDFLTYLTDICYELDIPTPMILKNHKRNFTHFNVTKFRKSEFIEPVDFDLLQLENAAE